LKVVYFAYKRFHDQPEIQPGSVVLMFLKHWLNFALLAFRSGGLLAVGPFENSK
jgi:hypothetical protein